MPGGGFGGQLTPAHHPPGYYGGYPPTIPGMGSNSNYPQLGGGGGGTPLTNVNFNTQPDPNLSAITSTAMGGMTGSDPLLLEAIQNYRNRMSSDTTQRAIGRSAGAIDDSLASAMQRAREEASISGTSSGSQAARAAGMTDAAQRAKAGAAADITLGRERDLDALAGGFAGAAQMPGQRQLQWGGLALGAAGQNASNQLAGQQGQVSIAQLLMQQQQAQQQAMMQAYNLAYS